MQFRSLQDIWPDTGRRKVNNQDKEAFEKWWASERGVDDFPEGRAITVTERQLYEWEGQAWQAACEFKLKEIDGKYSEDIIFLDEKNRKLHFELDRMNNYIIPGYQQGIEELQNIIEKLQTENKDMISKLKCLKNDYWFMTTLIERYSSDKEQALNDCLERMKFRKPLFNFLEEE